MPHKVEISDKTYEDLKEFCVLNDLKIGQYADKLIHDGLMIEMYGDVPFTNYRKPVQEIVIPSEVKEEFKKGLKNAIVEGESNFLVNEDGIKAIDKETKDHMIETKVQFIEAPPISEDIIERKKALDKELLENIGIPTKVVNKITRRRLK